MAFAIRYLSRPPNRWKWVGRGEISFDHEQVSLRRRRHRLFMPGRPQELIAEGLRRHDQDKFNGGVEDLRKGLARREAIQSLGRRLY
jgi:hypothetical protein